MAVASTMSEKIPPIGEALVGGDDHQAALIPAGEQVEECRGLLAREGDMFQRLLEACMGELKILVAIAGL